MSDQVILRVATKIIVPTILLFALYVQFHGDYGPGGGFQAGVIFAAGFILYALVFGLRRTHRVLPTWVARVCASAGVLLYGGVGILTICSGGPSWTTASWPTTRNMASTTGSSSLSWVS